jgi:hypothetical protein
MDTLFLQLGTGSAGSNCLVARVPNALLIGDVFERRAYAKPIGANSKPVILKNEFSQEFTSRKPNFRQREFALSGHF